LADAADFYVRFWGVRGSVACPGPHYQRYGGNTSCLEVRCGPHALLFDAGTGARELGLKLAEEAPVDADLFFSHTHLDHIAGLPFFAPAFDPRNAFHLWAGHLAPEHDLRGVLGLMMKSPLFPVPLEIFQARITFNDFTAGTEIEPRPGVKVRTASLSHPDRATGYRVEFNGRAICYVTDTEHSADGPDQNILALIAGADIVVYDCMYTDETYPKYRGWGHSTWQEGVRLCNAAAARRLVIFHHDPAHDDPAMDRIAVQAEAMRPGTIVAREGMILRP
jgi:phosphoribosyl 1,2-cyclic phosphodiesterase